jgi:hypothetical protein
MQKRMSCRDRRMRQVNDAFIDSDAKELRGFVKYVSLSNGKAGSIRN